MNIDEIKKRCPSCGEDKLLTSEHWHKNAARPGGWSSICKECKKKADKERYLSNNGSLEKQKERKIRQLKKEHRRKYKDDLIDDLIEKDPGYQKELWAIVNEYAAQTKDLS